jgi:hypothetical protein
MLGYVQRRGISIPFAFYKCPIEKVLVKLRTKTGKYAQNNAASVILFIFIIPEERLKKNHELTFFI